MQGENVKNPRFLLFILTLCEKLSTFYVTVVLSLLLRATGNEARNRRWTENTWLFFCSQLLNDKSLDHFPKCPAVFCLLSLLSYLYNYTADWQCWIQERLSGNLTFRLINYLPLITATITFSDIPSSQFGRKYWESRQERKQFLLWRLRRCPSMHDLREGGTGRRIFQGNNGIKHTEALKHMACPSNTKTSAL